MGASNTHLGVPDTHVGVSNTLSVDSIESAAAAGRPALLYLASAVVALFASRR